MSEKAVGYTTIGGDLEGALAVIANVPKTVVNYLLDYLLEKTKLRRASADAREAGVGRARRRHGGREGAHALPRARRLLRALRRREDVARRGAVALRAMFPEHADDSSTPGRRSSRGCSRSRSTSGCRRRSRCTSATSTSIASARCSCRWCSGRVAAEVVIDEILRRHGIAGPATLFARQGADAFAWRRARPSVDAERPT